MRLRKFCLCGVVITSILAGVCNVYAQEYTNESSGTPTVPVTYNQASTFTVVIPESLNINESTKTSNFEVYLSDYDLAGDKAVLVSTDSEVILEEQIVGVGNKKDDVTATVSFTNSKLHDGTKVGGTIEARGLSAGKWEGTMTFEISLVDRD